MKASEKTSSSGKKCLTGFVRQAVKMQSGEAAA